MKTPNANVPINTDHGPHGGILVKTSGGFVEISIFETGVPPRFHLYFFDESKTPLPMPIQDISIETIRPDGKMQIFEFRSDADYLESTSDIPEPHEFTVKLDVGHNGHTHSYHSEFTEEGHEHGHSHGDHDQGSDFIGWLKGICGHSHSVVDKVDTAMKSSERGIRTLKISLVALGFTAALQLIVVFISGSVALLADTIHNFADAGTSIPLWIAFSLARRGANRRFTYGYGKAEDVAGVIIVLIIFFSACVTAYEAAMKIIHPQPISNLGWVALAAIIGFIGNEAVAIFRIRTGEEIGSAALIADGQHARIDGFTSLAVLIGVAGAWLGFPILDPVVGVLITVALLFIVKEAAVSVWTRLIDGIEPEILSEIEHAPTHIPGVRSVHSVRARWLGHRVYSDVAINVDPSLSVQEANEIAKKVEKSLRDHVRLLESVVVRICPEEKQGTQHRG